MVYTQAARRALMDIGDLAAFGMRASTEPYAKLLAQTARQRFSATWALAESGATGPTGNRYGDAAGHCCLAFVAGPRSSGCARSRPAAPTAPPTCAPSPPPGLTFCSRRWSVNTSWRPVE